MYPLEQIRLPYAPQDDRADIPTAAFAHNCPIANYNLPTPLLLKATQAYYACVSFIDAQVGRILDALDRLGLRDDTIVVFWSDHGYHLGEHHGIWQKRTLFEQSARSPLIMRSTGAAGNGTACRRIVEFVDIYPTLTDLSGIESPSGLAGRSFASVARRSKSRVAGPRHNTSSAACRRPSRNRGHGLQYPYPALAIHRME